MILKRKEYLGTKDGNDVLGRDYFIDSDSERIVDENFNPFYSKTRYENEINNLIDEFEEGYNRLEEIDGVLYEVYGFDYTMVRIRRKAYLSNPWQNTPTSTGGGEFTRRRSIENGMKI